MRISDWSSDVCSSDLNQREHIKRFLAEHFPQADAPPEAFDGEIDDLVRHCREHGLRSQRAVALYVLAAWLFGGDAIRGDAGLNAILQAREQPPAERSLLIEIRLNQAWGSLPRTTRP